MEGARERTIRALHAQVIGAARLARLTAVAGEGDGAPLDAQTDVVPSDAGDLGRDDERVALLAKIHSGDPPRQLGPLRRSAAPQRRLEQPVEPLLEAAQLAQRIPGRGGHVAAGATRGARAHRLPSST